MRNSGILLKKSGESSYSIYRRFLIANQMLTKSSYTEYFNLLRDSLGISYRHFNESNVILKSEEKLYGFPAIHLKEVGQYFQNYRYKIRQCQNCSEIGYHSDIFQLPWISHCPVHQAAITDKCSSCNLYWPSVVGIWSRNCSSCGRRISPKELNDRGAFSKENDFNLIERIINFLENIPVDEWGICTAIKCHGESSRVTGCGPDACNSYFPSVVASVNAQWLDVCREAKIGLSQTQIFKFPLLPVSTYQRSPEPKDPTSTWEARSCSLALRAIRYHVSVTLGKEHHLSMISPDIRDMRRPLCPYCLAFTVWCHLAAGKRLDFHERPDTWWNFAFSSPFQPIPLNYPQPYISLRHDGFSQNLDSREYALPERARRALYFISLWNSYLYVVKYLVSYTEALFHGVSWVTFLNEISFPDTENQFLKSIGCFISDDNYISLVIPRDALPSRAFFPKISPDILSDTSHGVRLIPSRHGITISIDSYLTDPSGSNNPKIKKEAVEIIRQRKALQKIRRPYYWKNPR